MLRLLMFICLLGSAPASACAQQARDRLEGFGAVKFGTSFDDVKNILGPDAKVSEKKAKDGRSIKLLEFDFTLDGQKYIGVYAFGSDDRLTLVRIVPRLPRDQSECHAIAARLRADLIQQHGTPSRENKIADTVTALIFEFKDGNFIESYAVWLSGVCVLYTTYATPQGERDGA